jgi:hypothetical protein
MGKKKRMIEKLQAEIDAKPIDFAGYSKTKNTSTASVAATLQGVSMHGYKYNYKGLGSCGPNDIGDPTIKKPTKKTDKLINKAMDKGAKKKNNLLDYLDYLEGKHPGTKKMLKEVGLSAAASALEYGVGLIQNSSNKKVSADSSFRERFIGAQNPQQVYDYDPSPNSGYQQSRKKYSEGSFS